MTHICVSNLAIIGSDNGLSPGRRQAIIWTNAGILLIGPIESDPNAPSTCSETGGKQWQHSIRGWRNSIMVHKHINSVHINTLQTDKICGVYMFRILWKHVLLYRSMLLLHTTVGRVEMPFCCHAKTVLTIYDIITSLDKLMCPRCMRQRARVGNGATIRLVSLVVEF